MIVDHAPPAAFYRPASRAVFLVTSAGILMLPEDEAEGLAKAIQEALAVRDHARAMLGEQGCGEHE